MLYGREQNGKIRWKKEVLKLGEVTPQNRKSSMQLGKFIQPRCGERASGNRSSIQGSFQEYNIFTETPLLTLVWRRSTPSEGVVADRLCRPGGRSVFAFASNIDFTKRYRGAWETCV